MRALLLVSLLFSQAALADSFFVKEAGGTGSADEKSAVRELVIAAVPGVKGHKITNKEDAADFVLEPRLVKLSSSYVVYLNKTKGGSTVFGQQMRASDFDDIDTVTTRLVRAVINEVEVKEDKRVSEVTRDEVTRGTLRREATRQWMIGFGPMGMDNVSKNTSGFNFLLSYLWGVSPQVDLQLGFEGGSLKDTGSRISHFFVGGNYYFSEAEIAPYASAVFGYGSADTGGNAGVLVVDDEYNKSGFTAGIGVGAKFFRSSNVNLAIGAKAITLMSKTPYGSPIGYLSYIAVCF